MKEFLRKVRDRKFELDDPEFLRKAFRHRHLLHFEGSREPIHSLTDITSENTLVSVRLSTRGYKIVGRRTLFA
jgi:hypothetical protein